MPQTRQHRGRATQQGGEQPFAVLAWNHQRGGFYRLVSEHDGYGEAEREAADQHRATHGDDWAKYGDRFLPVERAVYEAKHGELPNPARVTANKGRWDDEGWE